MRIGIDISQVVYEGTGVGKYVQNLVRALLAIDTKNTYVLFGASLSRQDKLRSFFRSVQNERVVLRLLPLPAWVLDMLWNQLHIIPIEMLTGPLDVFWSSDWTQPPLKYARGITTIHDLSVLTHPESFNGTDIVDVQKRRLGRVKKECTHVLCDSVATACDAKELLGIERSTVVYPGL